MSDYKNEFLKKIDNKSVIVGIIGLGYVGLPLALAFAKKGIKSIGFDVDETKIPKINNGESYIKHIGSEKIKNAVEKKLFSATSDFTKLVDVDAIIICVPTPLDVHREPDMSFVINSANVVAKNLRKGQLVVLESSTYPGTTEEILLPKCANQKNENWKVGEDFFLAYSPEREDPGNPIFETGTIPKLVGGMTKNCLEISTKLYSEVIVKTVPVSSPKIAEATKLYENIFRSVNIALVNELKMTFDKMGIDIWEVIEAAKTKPFGFMPFYPGPGLGGHCIPIDPFYLTWKAREYGMATRFIELAGEINTAMPDYVVHQTQDALNKIGKALNGAKILILGLAYKANIDDLRESPSFAIMEKLESKGAIVEFNDPFIPMIHQTREHAKYTGKKSVEISENFDVFIIATAHDEYKKIDFSKFTIPIIDTRNVI